MSREAYVHRSEPGAEGGPLLFLFHGTGGDENQMIGLGRDILPGAHLVAPRGDVSEGGALRYFRRTGMGAYDMDDLARRTTAMTAFVTAVAEEEAPPATIALGYSNGANIIAVMQFGEPGLFNAAVLMHPLIPFAPAPADFTGKRVLITAGRRDPLCPEQQTLELAEYYRANGAALDLFWHNGGHEVGPGEVEAIRAFLAQYQPG